MRTFLEWHMGLGDIIVCSGMANHLSNTKEVTVPCQTHQYESVRSLFTEKIEVVTTFDTSQYELLKLGGYSSIGWGDEDFCHWFYRQAGLDYEISFSECPIEQQAKKIKQLPIPVGEYNFLHDKGSQGRFIVNRDWIRGDYIESKDQGSILQYCDILKNAKEIHCVDSSFFHLVERIETKGKLFYHKWNCSESYRPYRKQWHIINY